MAILGLLVLHGLYLDDLSLHIPTRVHETYCLRCRGIHEKLADLRIQRGITLPLEAHVYELQRAPGFCLIKFYILSFV